MENNQDNADVTFTNASVLTESLLVISVQKMARDMRFFAIFYLIYGALMSLTIIGAIIGVPMIIYNMKLKQSADEFENFLERKDFYSLLQAFENQRKFFFFHKILIILLLVFLLVYLFLFIYIGSSLMMPNEAHFV